MNRIITIGREFGSGGRTIAKQVAEKLGIPCFDSELLVRIAEESGFDEKFVSERGDTMSLSTVISRGLSGQGYYNYLNTDDHLWEVQRKVICELAEKESCVIVGRCADYILRDKADCLNVFIYADMEKRAERIVNVYGESSDAPIKRLKKKDKNRKAFYEYHTDVRWGDTHTYDICLDSSELGIEKCVEIIASLY